MTDELEHLAVLEAYPYDCRPLEVESLGSANGLSGARFWRVHTDSGTLCLRRWPKDRPKPERLEFIQAVLWHVNREGFRLAPLPCETRSHAGYVRHAGHLWQLEPWMPGTADYLRSPSLDKLLAATVALAEFHRAAATFPLPDPPVSRSPGIKDRSIRLSRWLSGDLDRLQQSITLGVCPELAERAARICSLVPSFAGEVGELLDSCSRYGVSLQPCIRDIRHAHVLLLDEGRVGGLIDFGSLGTDNVAVDLAALLGSMAGDDAQLWSAGLAAYRSTRSISGAEMALVEAVDRSTVLTAGLDWLDAIYRQRRVPDDSAAVLGRLDEIVPRLEHLDRHGPSVWL